MPISLTDFLLSRYCVALVPEMTPSPGDRDQPAGDLLGNAVAEVTVLRGAQVLEREDDDPRRLGRLLPAVGHAEREQQRGRRDGTQADQQWAVLPRTGRLSRRSADPAPSSAVANSAADANRSPGSFANALASAPSTGSGTSDRRERSGSSGATTCCAMTDCGVGPTNGGSPASIS